MRPIAVAHTFKINRRIRSGAYCDDAIGGMIHTDSPPIQLTTSVTTDANVQVS
jgi:hypothetical protein